jgi:RHS repeat-associated protein
VLKLDYTYGATDNNGNIKTQTITVPGTAQSFAQTYTYDELNRLKIAEESAGLTQVWKQIYSYDRYGNRTLMGGTTYPAQLDATNNPAVSEANNRITSAGYVYDEAGNLKCDARHQCSTGGPLSAPALNLNIAYFDYDAENRMVRAGAGGADAHEGGANYSYDAGGKRVKKIVGNVTTVFIYDAMGMLVAEYGGQQPTTGGTSYVTTDTLGSTRVVTGQNQQIKARYDYLPFGEELPSNVGGRSSIPGYGTADDVRRRFGTYERDDELIDLDFAQARYYNFRHGRFTSADPLMASADIVNPQSFNRYVYVGNNPTNVSDPTGEIWGELNGAVQWFETAGEMKTQGFHAYTALVAQIKGTTQLVALNPYANQISEVANASQAVQELVKWGAAAEIVGEAASALGLPALAVGAAIAGYYAAEDSLDGRPEPVSGFKMAKWQERYIDRVLSKMNEANAESESSSANTQGESSPANPDPNDNKPNASANRGDNSNRSFEPQGTVKMLSKGEIKMLEKAGIDVHDVKGGKGASRYDLFKDQKGNIFVALKGGKGEFDPTGLNINDY